VGKTSERSRKSSSHSVARLPRQLQTIEVRVGHHDKFSLTSLIRSHPCVAIGRMRFLRIHGETSFRVAAMTIETEAASKY